VSTIALIIALAALALGVFLFIVMRKLIDAMKLAGEALEEIAKLLEQRG
jgi:uncharacterized protein YoxC